MKLKIYVQPKGNEKASKNKHTTDEGEGLPEGF